MKKILFIIIIGMIISAAMPMQAETKPNKATKTEQVTAKSQDQETDKNPIVGQDKKGRTIHQGSRGGLYYWTTYKRGEKAGQAKKAYLTKAEKEEFYKSHPQVKRPQQ